MAESQTGSGSIADGPYKAVVQELRERNDYATDQWREIVEEGNTDMAYVAGDPWDPQDRQTREDAKRPVMSFDEFGQYVNQLINQIRLHKRAIHVTPLGAGANDKKAQVRADLIRQIEYRSNAQQAYTAAFENTVQRSYGFWRIKAKFVTQPAESGGDGSGFNQELVIESCPNPNLITPDPDILSPTGSDMRYLFQKESWALSDYRKKFPKAKVIDFTPQLAQDAPAWIDQSRIQLAEYWTVEKGTERLFLFKGLGQGGRDLEVLASDLKKPDYARLIGDRDPDKERDVERPKVMQYLTNGFEILGTPTEWPGKYIPYVCCFGKILYTTDGGKNTKRIMSLVRLARDPAMFYSYIRTCQAEIVGGVPRTSWIGYEGQFSNHEDNWQRSNHEPVVYLEAKATTEATGQTVLPLPVRQPWDPQVHNLEVIAEAARRAIQAAMGTTPLPTAAQRKNEKSGVALESIRQSEQQGSFHFVDAYESAVTQGGVILEDLLPHYYDAARDITTRTQADETKVIRVNDPTNLSPGQDEPVDIDHGDYDVTLSTGPASDSERATANEFADAMVANIEMIAKVSGPPVAAKLLALSIRLKNIGPLGDEMADLIAPPEPEDGQPADPEALKQQLDQAMQLLQQAQQDIATDAAKTQGELEKVKLQQIAENERAGAKLESDQKIAQLNNQAKLDIERMKIVADLLKTRATLEANQTEAMIDAATNDLNQAVAMAGDREAREAVAQDSEAGRQHASDEAERQRAHEVAVAGSVEDDTEDA